MDWSHAPPHRTKEPGGYFITAGTYKKQHFLLEENRREFLINLIWSCAAQLDLIVQAWVVLSNHYHLVLEAAQDSNIPLFAKRLHSISARQVNELDDTPGRRVWYQYWDKFITDERSYYARINYIHQNPVRHGIVSAAENYRWSSMRWFEDRVGIPLASAVRQIKIDRIKVVDNF
jgi:putative transposase